MSKLSVKLEYEKKAQELRKLTEIEALKLQKAIESKDLALLEIRNLAEKKSNINKTIAGLEKEIKEKQEYLNQLLERERGFVSSVKIELKKEKESLNETKEKVELLNENLKSLSRLSAEIQEFIQKEKDIRAEYSKQQEKLNISQKEYKEVKDTLKSEREFLEVKNKELDFYKQYIVDLYGKLASYVNVAKNTIEYVNEEIKKTGTPIQFDLPPGEIIKIDFNNFDKKPKDT